MARGKGLTPEDLLELGAEQLAKLLAEACQGDQRLRQRIELLCASKQGADRIVDVLGRRVASLSDARGFVEGNEIHSLAGEVGDLREAIAGELGLRDAQAAVELMWRFLAVAQSMMKRVDDPDGEIAEEFQCAAEDLGSLLVQVPDRDRIALAERLHASLGKDEHDFTAAIIGFPPEALGTEGRAKLRQLLKRDIARLPSWREGEDWGSIGLPRARISTYLAGLAQVEQDVDAYIEAVRLGHREHIDGAGVAKRLIEAGRSLEALDWLEKDRRAGRGSDPTIVDLKIAALEALGRREEAQALRWSMFEATLSAEHLRGYLKRLPDFEDFEPERKALAHAAAFPSAMAALNFLTHWRAFEVADRLVRQRIAELDGKEYILIGRAAEALMEKWPGSATLLYRALVQSVLERGFSKAYPYAARDLASVATLAPRLAASTGIPTHQDFCAGLKAKHGRKHAFWQLVERASPAQT